MVLLLVLAIVALASAVRAGQVSVGKAYSVVPAAAVTALALAYMLWPGAR